MYPASSPAVEWEPCFGSIEKDGKDENITSENDVGIASKRMKNTECKHRSTVKKRQTNQN